MCEFAAAVSMASAGLSALLGASQQSQQATAQRNNALYQAALAHNAASVSEYHAQDAERRGAAEEESRRRKTALAIGAQQARFAAQGSDLSGSPLDVLGDTAALGELEALTLRYQGEREAWARRIEGANNLSQERIYQMAAANVDPSYGIATSLLGGVASMVRTADAAGFFKPKSPTTPNTAK